MGVYYEREGYILGRRVYSGRSHIAVLKGRCVLGGRCKL